jgi:hypothetical protein
MKSRQNKNNNRTLSSSAAVCGAPFLRVFTMIPCKSAVVKRFLHFFAANPAFFACLSAADEKAPRGMHKISFLRRREKSRKRSRP